MENSIDRGVGTVVGKKAPNFSLLDSQGRSFEFFDALRQGPAVIAFYPGDFTRVCTKQLCNYRDNWDEFSNLGVQVVGVSKNPVEQHVKFNQQYQFPFPLLSDPDHKVAKAYGCASILLLGGISRATVIV